MDRRQWNGQKNSSGRDRLWMGRHVSHPGAEFSTASSGTFRCAKRNIFCPVDGNQEGAEVADLELAAGLAGSGDTAIYAHHLIARVVDERDLAVALIQIVHRERHFRSRRVSPGRGPVRGRWPRRLAV